MFESYKCVVKSGGMGLTRGFALFKSSISCLSSPCLSSASCSVNDQLHYYVLTEAQHHTHLELLLNLITFFLKLLMGFLQGSVHGRFRTLRKNSQEWKTDKIAMATTDLDCLSLSPEVRESIP